MEKINNALEIVQISFDAKDLFYIQNCLKNIKTDMNLIEKIIKKTIDNEQNYKLKGENNGK